MGKGWIYFTDCTKVRRQMAHVVFCSSESKDEEEENIARKYPLGYATSKDGINWERYGEEKYGEPLEFKTSDEGWDS